MTTATFGLTGTLATSTTGTLSPPWPSGYAVGDLAIMVVESAAGLPVFTTQGAFQLLSQTTTNSDSNLSVYWCLVDSTSMTRPVFAALSDHGCGAIFTFTGGYSAGTPIDLAGIAIRQLDASPVSTTTAPAITTPADNMLVVNVISHDADITGGTFTSEANSSLTSVTEQYDQSTAAGNGGGFGIITGIKATAGSVSATTATVTTGANTKRTAAITFGIFPSDYNPVTTIGADGSSAGVASTSGVSKTVLPSAPAVTGVGTATGVSGATAGAVGSAAGTSTAVSGIVDATGSAAGTATATGIADPVPQLGLLGTDTNSTTGTCSPPWPSGYEIGDLALMVVECSADAAPSLSTPGAFTLLQASTFNAISTLAVYWCVVDSLSMVRPVFAARSDHQHAKIITFKNVYSTDPIEASAVKQLDGTATTNPLGAGCTTAVDHCLVVDFISRETDDAGAKFFGETNSDVTEITAVYDAGTTSGDGGGYTIITSNKETAGTVGAMSTSVTTAVQSAAVTVAIRSFAYTSPATVIEATGTSAGVASIASHTNAIGSGVVAVACAATATGAAQSTAGGVASSSGVATITNHASTLILSAGSATGLGTSTGTSGATVSSAASATGVATASANTVRVIPGVGTSTDSATANMFVATVAQVTGTSAGTAATAATASKVLDAAGVVAGLASASATSGATAGSVGALAGTGAVAGPSNALYGSTASAAGGTATSGTSGATSGVVGSSTGIATVFGDTLEGDIQQADGASSSMASATGVSGATVQVAGQSIALSTTTGGGQAQAQTSGTTSGVAVAGGFTSYFLPMDGQAAGTVDVEVFTGASAQSVGSSAGTSDVFVDAQGNGVLEADGFVAGIADATAFMQAFAQAEVDIAASASLDVQVAAIGTAFGNVPGQATVTSATVSMATADGAVVGFSLAVGYATSNVLQRTMSSFFMFFP